MAVLHAQQISHGDLKPANLLVSASGKLKLIDFGSAQRSSGSSAEVLPLFDAITPVEEQVTASPTGPTVVNSEERAGAEHQNTGGILDSPVKVMGNLSGAGSALGRISGPSDMLRRTQGTPAFMAPEVCAGGWFQGCAADCWALGVCLFLAVTGRLPFTAHSVHQLYSNIRRALLDMI